jgi:Cu/Ag efflux protein CusF
MSANRLTASIAAGALTALIATGPGFAQNARPHHIRGTIESLEGRTLTVKTRRGATDKLTLADNPKVFTVSPAKMSDIKSGEFVGITSVEKNGKAQAVEVHVFDEKLRGLGEGHYPWDLESQPNMMTNASIAQVKSVKGGDELKLDYKGGTQTITVPPNAPVVMFTEGSPSELKPGAKVFILAKKQNGGEVANAVVVGNGVTPPM